MFISSIYLEKKLISLNVEPYAWLTPIRIIIIKVLCNYHNMIMAYSSGLFGAVIESIERQWN